MQNNKKHVCKPTCQCWTLLFVHYDSAELKEIPVQEGLVHYIRCSMKKNYRNGCVNIDLAVGLRAHVHKHGEKPECHTIIRISI